MTEKVTFGPFRLVRPLGTGGMGKVWHAVHDTQDHPVAIKVLTARRVRKQRFLNAFYREVRAVARLNHPNVIRVFDSGQVSEEAAERSGKEMIAGSPYLVMERAQSTLANVKHENLTWPHVHTILMHVLDGLAHAHARGLVHRDLKPGNVLFLSADNEAHLKLSDFGLAHAINSPLQIDDTEEQRISGTPSYMAPEQITGQLRDQGPWTDLYALGCLAYWLSCETPPFSAQDTDEVLRSHLTCDKPPMEPTIDAPEGFAKWVARLVRRNPEERYRRAADAAYRLAQLGEGMPSTALSFRAGSGEEETVDMTLVDDTEGSQIFEHTIAAGGFDFSADTDSGVETDEFPLPEFPDNWRYERPVESMQMVGVGLGLYGLREVPLVGRQNERDRLWTGLADARHTGLVHGAIVSGPAGIGKTRLARWLGERAHEVGAVSVLEAAHNPISDPTHGLARMFADYFGCTGLSLEKILERIRNFYGRNGTVTEDELRECMAVSALLARSVDPDFDEERAPVRVGDAVEIHTLYERLLDRLTNHRPVLLLLDDVHWGHDTLQFVRHLFEETDANHLPVYIAMTVRSDALDDHPATDRLLSKLSAKPFVHDLPLAPLDDDEHHELVRNLLGLEPKVADQVARRTAGNPLFAIQLVGDWVERGILQFSTEGFRLPDQEEAPLPDDIHQLLVQRLEKLVGQPVDQPARPPLLSLELAAALGRDIDYGEWEHVCELTGVDICAELLDEMASQSLAETDEHGWNFIHGALRETLIRLATKHRRLKAHHRLCAKMLRERYDTSSDAMAPRIARHLLAAGDHEEALAPLLQAIRHYRVTCDFEAGDTFYAHYEEARNHLGIDENDRRTVEGWIARAATLRRQVRLEKAVDLLERSEQIARRNDWPSLLSRVLLDRASASASLSRLEDALSCGREALELNEELENDFGAARARFEIGWAHKWQGAYERARQYLEEAEQQFRDLGEEHQRARALHSLSSVYLGLGERERAEELIRKALELFEAIGDLKGVSHCYTNLGENHRYRGNLAAAEKYYARALQTGERIGLDRDLIYPFNLGITLAQEEKFDEALSYLRQAHELASTSDRPGYRALTHSALCSVAAGRGDWTAFDAHLQRACENLDASSFVERDIALSLEQAGDHARKANREHRAEKAYRTALKQWRQLDAHERIEVVSGWLE